MNKLKCRKQKMNGSFECKRTNKIINIKECNNCKHKAYKNNNQISKPNKTKDNTTFNIKNSTFKSNKKSSKLAKLERNRKSVFTDDLEHCILCGNKKDHFHEIFFGNKRQKSMELGFVIPLCFPCHTEMHANREWQDFWHKQGQLYFEKNIGSREEFIRIFGKNYL